MISATKTAEIEDRLTKNMEILIDNHLKAINANDYQASGHIIREIRCVSEILSCINKDLR